MVRTKSRHQHLDYAVRLLLDHSVQGPSPVAENREIQEENRDETHDLIGRLVRILRLEPAQRERVIGQDFGELLSGDARFVHYFLELQRLRRSVQQADEAGLSRDEDAGGTLLLNHHLRPLDQEHIDLILANGGLTIGDALVIVRLDRCFYSPGQDVEDCQELIVGFPHHTQFICHSVIAVDDCGKNNYRHHHRHQYQGRNAVGPSPRSLPDFSAGYQPDRTERSHRATASRNT